jgi:DNA-binding transcriptional LysR family regulator
MMSENLAALLVAVAGVGVALVREDLAREAEAQGELCLWPKARIETQLQFIWPEARSAEPALAALIGVVDEAWEDSRTGPAGAAASPELASAAG